MFYQASTKAYYHSPSETDARAFAALAKLYY